MLISIRNREEVEHSDIIVTPVEDIDENKLPDVKEYGSAGPVEAVV